MSGRWLLLASLVLVAGFAPAPFPKSRPQKELSDLSKMQGTWDVVERYFGGNSVLTEPTQVRVTGTRFEFLVRGQRRSDWTLELKPTESPRRMDRRAVGGGTELLGIYRFEGDRLILCYSQGGQRPRQFDGKGDFLMVLRR